MRPYEDPMAPYRGVIPLGAKPPTAHIGNIRVPSSLVLPEGYVRTTERQGPAVIVRLTVATTAEKLLELLLEALAFMGDDIKIVIQSTREHCMRGFETAFPDPVMIESAFRTYDDVLLGDAYTGVAIVDEIAPAEIRLDEHKTLVVHNAPRFERFLRAQQIPTRETMPFVADVTHDHLADPELDERFDTLLTDIGADGGNW